MNISNFKRGQFITRIEGAVGKQDYSLIGKKVKLVGIGNGCIYVEGEDSYRYTLLLMFFSEGWELYVDIDSLASEQIDVKKDEDKELFEQFELLITKLHECEDYELLSRLKKILDNHVKA